MFERYRNLINLNEYFANEFGKKDYNSSKIFELDNCSYETNGVSARFWISDKDGCKYLFKQDLNYSDGVIYGELIASKIAEILNFPCPKVRACTLDGKIGLLSKNFLKPGEVIISGSEIIQEVLNNYSFIKESKSFFEDKDAMTLYGISDYVQNIEKEDFKIKQIHNSLNNLEELWPIIEDYLLRKNKFDKPKTQYEKISIIDNLVKTLMFDIITLQGDRHVDNWGIIRKSNGEYMPCPIYDNASCYCLDFKDLDKKIEQYNEQVSVYHNNLSNESNVESGKKNYKLQINFMNHIYKRKLLLTVSEDDILNAKTRKRKINVNILDYFLKVSDSIYVDLLVDMLNKINEFGISEIIEMVEKENGIIFPTKIANYIKSVYEENNKFMNEVLRNNGVEVVSNAK